MNAACPDRTAPRPSTNPLATNPLAVEDLAVEDLVSEARQMRKQLASGPGSNFRFVWSGMVVRGEVVESGPGGAALTLTCELGALPYTAENPGLRLQVLKILTKPDRSLPAHLRLGPGQRLEFTNVTRFDTRPGEAQLIHGLMVILLQMQPYLALFHGIRTPACRRTAMRRA